MRTFKIIYDTKLLKYKIQRRLLWGLIWYDVEEEELCGYDLISYTKYFNRMKEAEDYIQIHYTKGKEFLVKVFRTEY